MILIIISIVIICLIIWLKCLKKENLVGYRYETGVKYWGNPVKTTVSKISDCLIDCSSNPDCTRVIMDGKSDFYFSGDLSSLYDVNTCVHLGNDFQKQAAPSGTAALTFIKRNSTPYKNAYVPINNIVSRFHNIAVVNATLEECKDYCDSIMGCQGFVHSPLRGSYINDSRYRGYCAIKSNVTLDREPVSLGREADKYQTLYVKGTAQDISADAPNGYCNDKKTKKFNAAGSNCDDWTFYNNTDFASGEVLGGEKVDLNLFDCKTLCKSTPGCQGIVTNHAETECYMRGNMINQTTDNNWKSYKLAQHGKCSNLNPTLKKDALGTNCEDYFYISYATDYPGNNLGVAITNVSEQQCQQYCKDTQGCQGYTHASKTKGWGDDCYLKTSLTTGVTKGGHTSGLKTNYGFCDSGVPKNSTASNCFGECPRTRTTIFSEYKKDASDNCLGECPTGSVIKYKTDLLGTECFGRCPTPGSVRTWKNDISGSQCFGPCPPGTPGQWKTDYLGSQCWGRCPQGSVNTWKTDASGSRCWGRCPPNSEETWKNDASGTNCFGPCPEGSAEQYKFDASGSNCFGKCPNNPMLYALDEYGTGCYGPCPPGSIASWKTDVSGTECFGLCPEGSIEEWKTDASGTQCFGKCENDTTKWKLDISGTQCFGRCPPGSYYKWKTDPSGSKCYGRCPNGLFGFKKSMRDTCIGSNANMLNSSSSGSFATAGTIDYCTPSADDPNCVLPKDDDDWNVAENKFDAASMFSKYFRNFYGTQRIAGT